MGKEESGSLEGFTNKFCMTSDCMAEKPEFEGGPLVGVILGFSVTFLFMLFGAIKIIIDEIERHAKYNQDLIDDVEKLKNRYQLTDQQIKDIDEKFHERENAKQKTAKELETERLELMAKN